MPPGSRNADTQPVTVREFERFAADVKESLNRIEAHMEKQDDRHLATSLEIGQLKSNQLRAGKIAAGLSAIIAALITAIFHLLGGKGSV